MSCCDEQKGVKINSQTQLDDRESSLRRTIPLAGTEVETSTLSSTVTPGTPLGGGAPTLRRSPAPRQPIARARPGAGRTPRDTNPRRSASRHSTSFARATNPLPPPGYTPKAARVGVTSSSVVPCDAAHPHPKYTVSRQRGLGTGRPLMPLSLQDRRASPERQGHGGEKQEHRLTRSLEEPLPGSHSRQRVAAPAPPAVTSTDPGRGRHAGLPGPRLQSCGGARRESRRSVPATVKVAPLLLWPALGVKGKAGFSKESLTTSWTLRWYPRRRM